MKKLLAIILLAAMCIGVSVGNAQGTWLDQFIGYWELQNVALGSYTFGADYVDLDMTAVVHEDGIFFLVEGDRLFAEYINGYSRSYFLGEGEFRLDLSVDSQGRIHMTDYDEYGEAFDYRFRKAEAPVVESPMADYVGSWCLTKADEALYGELPMTIYEDGLGMLMSVGGPIGLRLGMYNGKVALVDNEGGFMPITHEADGSISFTMKYEDGAEDTFHMVRAF